MTNLSRRAILAGGIAGATALGASLLFAVNRLSGSARDIADVFTTPLPMPPLIDGRDIGNVVTLEAASGMTKFQQGAASRTLGYSGSYLGPVLRLHRGDTVTMTVANKLDRPTTVHWHGLLTPSDLDGGPHNSIAPDDVWQPSLTIDQPAATLWYHPHPHGDTARQVYLGLAGLIYVEDGSAQSLGLPNRYGVDDIPLILQDRAFGADGLLSYDNSPLAIQHGSRGNTLIVNGAVAPRSEVPVGVVRLRLLNGANARNFRLVFADRRPMHVIANDNGFITAPVAVSELTIAPGERYELLVDFSDGKLIPLLTYSDTISPPGTPASVDEGALTPVLLFAPGGAMKSASQYIPKRLVDAEPSAAAAAVRRRSFVLDGMAGANDALTKGASAPQTDSGAMPGMDHSQMGSAPATTGLSGLDLGMKMGINGAPFDMARIDAEMRLGATEIWELRSTEMAHPFHIHGASFRILSLDGTPPPDHATGAKDTVLVRETAEILVSFKHKTEAGKPFVFHCHILEHEDAGMMAQYVTS
jgi:FtsP/CotA-like multicopper oxidase with cupredoxin domain